MASLEDVGICKTYSQGLLFPLFPNEHEWSDGLRVALYGAGLIFVFIGIHFLVDKLMEAIDVIQNRKIRVRNKKTGKLVTKVRWSGAFCNLLLLVLGQSSPEILLSNTEIIRNKMHYGLIGPLTIVGSASVHFMFIVGVCIISAPKGELRKVKDIGLFGVTFFLALGTCLWFVLITNITSPDVIELWEGVLTLLIPPVIIIIAGCWDYGVFGRRNEDIARFLEQKEKSEEEEEEDTKALTTSNGGVQSPNLSAEMMSQDNPGSAVADDDASADGSQRIKREEAELEDDPSSPVLDDMGMPIKCRAGVVTFSYDVRNVTVGTSAKELKLPVYRKNSQEGIVFCRYRTEGLSAVPGYDYEESIGEIAFGNGISEAEIGVRILPKKVWQQSDSFQVILEDLDGGACFNPGHDGGAEHSVLTIKLVNPSSAGSKKGLARALFCMDCALNLSSLRKGFREWLYNIRRASFQISSVEGQKPTPTDYVWYACTVFWQVLINIVTPPPQHTGGWFSFIICLVSMGILMSVTGDLAGLLGCVTGWKDAFTGFVFVSFGISVPDFFLSRRAAKHDEWADASIANMPSTIFTGLLLGVGLPWSIQAFYWAAKGPDETWNYRYPEFAESYPDGVYVVALGTHFAFAVKTFCFCIAATMVLLMYRRVYYGGELGGAFVQKWVSGSLLFFLWGVTTFAVAFNMLAGFDGEMMERIFKVENLVTVLAAVLYIAFMGVSAADLLSGAW